jgi:release factor glutamine methyltransferase
MPATLAELLSWGKAELKGAGLDDYDISAELLLQSILNYSRSRLILNLSFPADSKAAQAYKRAIQKRSQRVPLQYLIGQVDFYNVRLKIDNRALIPRPETEILVETVIKKISNFASPKILDIGVGSGNILIALTKNIPGSRGVGVDISAAAVELAAVNAQLNDVADRVSFSVGDINNSPFFESIGKFQCVVSNPPYVANHDKKTLQPEIARYEPQVALFSGSDPLRFFKTIIGDISYILVPGGLLAFEVGMGQAIDVCGLLKPSFVGIEITKDLAGIERVVTGFYAGSDKK